MTFTHLEVAIHALLVCLLLQGCDIQHNFLVSSGILQNTYSMKQPDLYYFETMQMTSQSLVNVHREYSPVARILHTKFDWACNVIFMVPK